MNSFLEVETIFGASEARPGENAIFISINPDLVSDFGHFLNYERRMQEQCGRLGLDYCCFANGKTGLEGERLRRVFENDSGYYSMTRTSATGLEGRIAEEFHQAIVREIAALEAEAGRDYDQVFLFMYCGSSLLASTLCDFQWPSRMRLCVNAFWDFLQRAEHQSYAHVARLKFQDGVRLLAMSELHADGIRGLTGLNFACCANPPPLFGDREAYDIVRADQHPSDKAMDFVMASADVYVSASKYEGFGIPLLDAMRFGTKAVVSSIPPYMEIAGRIADYFDPRSPEDLAATVIEALDKPAPGSKVWRPWNQE